MKLYSDNGWQRTRQVIGDLAIVVWVGLCALVGKVVHDVTMLLAVPSRAAAAAGDGLAARLQDVAGQARKVPVVGNDLQTPVNSAGEEASKLAAASRDTVTSIGHLSLTLALVVAGLPILFALALYVPQRVRFARRAAAAQRFVDSDADLRLFALRSMANAALPRLDPISPDPVGAWLAGDPEVTRQLATLELRRVGLRPPSS